MSIPKKFTIAALGCRTNQYEGQAFREQLQAMGCVEAKEGEKADICIVNTCTVTEGADSSSRAAIRQFVREHEGAQVLVTGCFAERDPSSVLQIPGVTHLVSNKEKETLLAALFPDQELPEFSICQFEAHTRAFVKVQDGCNSFCSYCIIPYVRGRSRSRGVQEIVREVEGLIQQGFQEVVLTGINIGDFDGADPRNPVRLAELVAAIDSIPGLQRLRISSIDPDEVDEPLIEAILLGRRTCPSLHLVLQSGSNVILKRMNRKYTRHVFLESVARLRDRSPFFSFTTDVIVGFPGETEEDHQETLHVLEQVRFAKVHVFPYSDRPGTRASKMPGKISQEILRRRKNEILQTAERSAFLLRSFLVGHRVEVLTEGREAGNRWIYGHTPHFLQVGIESLNLLENQIVTVECIANTPSHLVGRIV